MTGSDEEYEGDLADIDAVKRWLRDRRDAAGLTQEELATFMNASTRVVLNAEKEGDPKAGLPRGYPFFRMLQRLGAVAPGAPVPAGPTLHDRLAALEAKADRTLELVAEALQLQAQELGDVGRARELGAEIQRLRDDQARRSAEDGRT